MLVEKTDLLNLFDDICKQYGIRATNAKGWSDIHTRANLVRRFKHWEDEGRRPVLLYCGDHDPAGIHIPQKLRENIDGVSNGILHGEPVGQLSQDLIIDRFGLNVETIDELGLTWIDGLSTGSGKDLSSPRHPDHKKPYVQEYLRQHGARKVEANALMAKPNEAKELLLDAIFKYWLPERLDEYQSFLARKQDEVRLAVDELRS